MGEYDTLTDYDEQLYLLSLCVERARANPASLVPKLRVESNTLWDILIYTDVSGGAEAWYYFDKQGNLKTLRIYNR
jgi:hypothetical protein